MFCRIPSRNSRRNLMEFFFEEITGKNFGRNPGRNVCRKFMKVFLEGSLVEMPGITPLEIPGRSHAELPKRSPEGIEKNLQEESRKIDTYILRRETLVLGKILNKSHDTVFGQNAGGTTGKIPRKNTTGGKILEEILEKKNFYRIPV